MFRKVLAATAVIASVAAIPAAAAQRMSPEAQLERALAGRVAGEPVDCINLRSIRNQRVITRTAILYEVGDTIYVNRPRSGAESLTQYRAQVARPFGGNRLCSIDTLQVIDPVSRVFEGSVFLGEFVPYRRAGRD